MTEPLVSIDEIRAAAERIRPAVARTPLVRAGGDREGTCAFHLKCEHFQPMGAFKLRGAYNVLSQLSPEGAPAASSPTRPATTGRPSRSARSCSVCAPWS